MHINRALLESSDITKHFMTATERQVKKKLCQLLIDKGHRKYAQRFWMFDFNIVDAKKHPEFTAAISFDEATVFLSSGFLGNGEGIFNQLDVLLRHELAHNLMMHQIRMMHVFKKIHANDPDEAYEHIKWSASLHEILNCIEDFEISNKRYTSEDKKIVKNMTLNGHIIGGLVTEDHRGWDKMPLETMYEELSKEIIKVNSEIRSDPIWQSGLGMLMDNDIFKPRIAVMVKRYSDYMRPSSIKAPIEVLIKTKQFSKFHPIYKDLIIKLYEAFKEITSDSDKQKLLDVVKAIADTAPQETFDLVSPFTAELVCTLYTPEDKGLAADVLKNMGGNINFDPLKFKINVKRKTNSQDYKDTWNKIIKNLDSNKFDDEVLQQLRDAIEKA